MNRIREEDDEMLNRQPTRRVSIQTVKCIPWSPVLRLSLFLLVWGVWRRFQEPESGDKDLDEAIAGE